MVTRENSLACCAEYKLLPLLALLPEASPISLADNKLALPSVGADSYTPLPYVVFTHKFCFT